MIAVAGGKGGCGKTTTALGLGRALARAGRDALVADADSAMPNLHALAGVPPEPTLADVSADASPEAVAHPDPVVPGVRILPAPADGTPADRTAAGGTRSAFARLGGADSRVLLDCPAGAGPDAAVPLRVADRVVVASLPTRESLRDAAKTAAMARALDARVVACAVVGTDTVPDGVTRLTGADATVAVPDGGDDPLRSPACERAYRRLRDSLGEVSDSQGV